MRTAYSLAKKPFFGRYQRPWKWPEGVAQGEWQRLSIDSKSGGTLAGLFGPAIGPARASIVCAHPMGVEAKGYFLKRGHADLLRKNGYNVLLFDFNGFGESTVGNFLYPVDVIAAGQAAKAQAPGLPLGVLGVSFGSSWALCALSRPGGEPHGFQAAVLECPFTSLDEYWYRYRVPYLMLKVMSRIFPKLAVDLRPIVQVGRLQDLGSLLFIYGERDTVTPPEMGDRFKNACSLPKDRVSLWLVPSGEHTKALSAAPREYESRVLRFFDQAFAK
jgi:alpha-beta hydrolase superfamily lysophospholipase